MSIPTQISKLGTRHARVFSCPPAQISVVNLTRNVRFRNSQIHGVDANMILPCARTLVQPGTRPTLPAHVGAVNRQRCSVLTETNESKASRVSHSSCMTTANLANSRVDDCRPPSSLKNCASSAIAVAYTSAWFYLGATHRCARIIANSEHVLSFGYAAPAVSTRPIARCGWFTSPASCRRSGKWPIVEATIVKTRKPKTLPTESAFARVT